MPANPTKQVAIVEDDPELREQLTKIVNSVPGVTCVGIYGSAEDALENIQKACPDVVLMDIRLPGISGIDCISKLKEIMPAVLIIVVTVYADSERIFQALRNGASGYLVKSGSPKQLREAIKDVTQGGSPMSPHIARRVVQYFHATGPATKSVEELSSREQEVIKLLSAGYIYKEIGESLNISYETVRSHVKHICQKMHVKSRVEAVVKHTRKN